MTTAARRRIRLQVPRPHAVQSQIIKQSSRFNVICAGRRTGKTKLALIRSVDPLVRLQRPVAYFAPTYKMMSEFWREAVSLYRPLITGVNKSEHRFELITGGSFQMWSLDSADTIRGRKYALALIDEAAMVADLENAWNAVIRPTLTDYEGGADFYSTPKGLNFFHAIYTRGQDDAFPEWASFHYPTLSNPFIKPAEVEAARAELPADVFRQEYLAEFVAGSGAVFRNITANLYSGEGESPEKHRGHYLIAGIDWGQVSDFTAVSVFCRDCSREVELDRFNKIDWHFQRERIRALFAKWGISQGQVELNSIGGPNFEELLAAGLPVRGFTTTAQSKPQVIQSLALALEKGEIKLLDAAVATRELEAFEAVRNQVTGRISYNSPQGHHDDTVIARALMNDLRTQGIGVFI